MTPEEYIYHTLLQRYMHALERLEAEELPIDKYIDLNQLLLELEEKLMIAYKRYSVYKSFNPNKQTI